MGNHEQLLEALLEQEAELSFSAFTNEMAWEIGSILVDAAREQGKAITADITRGEQQLFHYACAGTSPDNDRWIERKNRIVYRFHHSSYYYYWYLEHEGQSLEDRLRVSSFEYAPVGGAFPVIVKGVGVVGAITVSGLKHDEDHLFVVDALKRYRERGKAQG